MQMHGSIVPLAGIALPLFLVPAILLLKHGQQQRHWRHLERMRALASGAPVPPASSPPGAGAVIAIGAGVPILAILAALFATLNVHDYGPEQIGYAAVIWGFALTISFGALATSLVLGVLQHRAHARGASSSSAREADDSLKPNYDPDTFDVVSRRG